MIRISLVLVALALAAFVLVPIANAAKADKADAQEGTVVKAGDGKITITDSSDKEHTFTVAKDAKIECNDKACTLDDIKKGAKVKLKLEKDVVTSIMATLK